MLKACDDEMRDHQVVKTRGRKCKRRPITSPHRQHACSYPDFLGAVAADQRSVRAHEKKVDEHTLIYMIHWLKFH